jgi:hypothetical protein
LSWKRVVVLCATQEFIQVCEALMEVYHRKLVHLAGRFGFTRHKARRTLHFREAIVLELLSIQDRLGAYAGEF